MAKVMIDETKCVKCGLCSKVCPCKLLLAKEKGQMPDVRNDVMICFECNQCMAVCPVQAVRVEGVSYDDLKLVGPMPNQEQIAALFESRRSIRNYRQEPVNPETLQKIFDIAAYAPTGKNWELVKLLVINDPQKVQKVAEEMMPGLDLAARFMPLGGIVDSKVRRMLRAYPDKLAGMRKEMREMVDFRKDGIDRVFYNAPCLIIAYADTRNMMAESGCTTALSEIEVIANGFGIGTCWSGLLTICADLMPGFAKNLGIEKPYEICGCMMAGYPAFGHKRIPYRKPYDVRWL